MDSQFINYDGRSVHDMIELLLSASGDPEAIRRLQETIQAVDAKFTPVNTELARLEADKQDAGDYVTNGNVPGYPAFQFSDGLYGGAMKRSNNTIYNGLCLMGRYTNADPEETIGEWFRYERNSRQLQAMILKENATGWEHLMQWTADYDSGTISITGEYMDFSVRRIQNVVWVTYASALKQAIPASQASQTDVVLANLPPGFRPLNNSADMVCNNTADTFGMCLITGNGNIVIRSKNGFNNETVLVNNMFFTNNAIPTT